MSSTSRDGDHAPALEALRLAAVVGHVESEHGHRRVLDGDHTTLAVVLLHQLTLWINTQTHKKNALVFLQVKGGR